MEPSAFYQKKFIVDGRNADCTFSPNEIAIKFLEKSVFAFGEYANQMQSKIQVNAIINKLKIHRGFSLYHVSPKVKANQGARAIQCVNFEFEKSEAKEIEQWLGIVEKLIQGCRQYPPGKKLFVMINPFSGKGEAQQMWEQSKKILTTCCTPFEEYLTKSAGDAYQKAQNLPLDKYYGIVTVSGDGLLSEAVNGVLHRKDFEEATQALIFGIIPGGSGNGLAASLDAPDMVTATYAIANHTTRYLDIYQMRQQEKRIFGFLAIGWANLAAIDIQSEKMRWLGPFRFDVGGVLSMLSSDTFRGKLSYLASGLQDHNTVSTNQQIVPADLHDMSFSAEQDWVVVDDEFSSLHVCNTNRIMISPGPFAPHTRIADGYVDIIYSMKIDRFDYTKFLLDMEKGEHVNHDFVKYIKTKEFKLEPQRKKDTPQAPITFDGEALTDDPIHVKVHQALLNVFCDSGDSVL